MNITQELNIITMNNLDKYNTMITYLVQKNIFNYLLLFNLGYINRKMPISKHIKDINYLIIL